MTKEQRELLERFSEYVDRERILLAVKACLEELAAAERVISQARGWLKWVKAHGSEFDGLPPAIEAYDKIKQYTQFDRKAP